MSTPSAFRIAGREIGAGQPCYVIAEAGVNHNGELELAMRLIDAGAAAGADAIKFQTFSAGRLASPAAAKAEYQREGDSSASQLEMLTRLELSVDDHRRLIAHARDKRIEFLSTPFDGESADLLDSLGVPAFKIGSGDLTDRFLLSRVARFGRPVLLSTGGATLADVRDALDVVRESGNPPIALLHCVSTYPTAAERTNLLAMEEIRRAFNCPVGFSDHSPDGLAPVLAVALGACILEKHLTLSRALDGPDQSFSLEPSGFRDMVADIRRAEGAMGNGRKEPQPGEREIMAVARKSLFAARRIEPGGVIQADDLVALRPAGGISPMRANTVIGRIARAAIDKGEILSLDMLDAPQPQ